LGSPRTIEGGGSVGGVVGERWCRGSGVGPAATQIPARSGGKWDNVLGWELQWVLGKVLRCLSGTRSEREGSS
jgi:hypothetical protein